MIDHIIDNRFSINFYFLLLTVCLLFVWSIKRRSHFSMRLIASVTAGLIICIFMPGLRAFGIIMTYPVIFFLVLGIIYIDFNVNLKQLAIYGIASMALQNLVSNVCAMVLTNMNSQILISDLMFAVLLALVYAPFIKKVRSEEYLRISTKRLVFIFFILCAAVFILSPKLRMLRIEGESIIIGKMLIALLDALLLFIEFDTFVENKMHNENEKLELLLRFKKEQQQLAEENIEIINRKCHDLKHQIAGLHLLTDNSEHRKYIKDLENSIMIYDSITKTGNNALDIILTEKKLLCEKYGIRLTYIVDGEKMAFMSAPDIYSLFGNALDNAIEALCEVEDETKRLVNLNVVARNNFLSINMENYCSNELIIKDGLPVTTKKNRDYHGFGLKSMRYVSEKYGGVMNSAVNKNMFHVNIVIPIPAASA